MKRKTLMLPVLALSALLAGCAAQPITQGAAPGGHATYVAHKAPASTSRATTAEVMRTVRKLMGTQHLRAALVRVTVDGKNVVTAAEGTSMDGVPATTDMHFRNGAVAFAYIGTLLMEYVDQHKVSLDDTIDRWVPSLPDSDKVTLKMLANQTSGYPDYETDPAWTAAFNANPFHLWTYDERIRYAFSRPVLFPPGSNWSYAHTNFMVLGHILSMVGKKPLDELLREKVLNPMGLRGTTATQTSAIPDPVLHAYSSERREALGISPKKAFYEESTFWNAQWGTPIGANETSTIQDLTRTAVKVGTGALLSRASYHAMTDPNLLGFGHKEPNCAPSCFTQVNGYNYGLGIVRSGSWILQNPMLGGYSATEAYLPSQRVAIAVVVTYEPRAFDSQGNYRNASDTLFRAIGAIVAPQDPPPTHNG